MNLEINRKNIKNVIIKVEDGIIKVSAPYKISDREIKRIVEKNRDKVERLKIKDKHKNRYKNLLFGEKIETSSEIELEKVYRRNLEKVLDDIFYKYEKITGLSPTSVEIRKMKIRWGTCYPDKKAIKINLKLAERPIEQIEAVVLHELIHLKYFYHDENFINECEKYLPNYKELERELKS